jgi:hypothetical protein
MTTSARGCRRASRRLRGWARRLRPLRQRPPPATASRWPPWRARRTQGRGRARLRLGATGRQRPRCRLEAGEGSVAAASRGARQMRGRGTRRWQRRGRRHRVGDGAAAARHGRRPPLPPAPAAAGCGAGQGASWLVLLVLFARAPLYRPSVMAHACVSTFVEGDASRTSKPWNGRGSKARSKARLGRLRWVSILRV